MAVLPAPDRGDTQELITPIFSTHVDMKYRIECDTPLTKFILSAAASSNEMHI